MPTEAVYWDLAIDVAVWAAVADLSDVIRLERIVCGQRDPNGVTTTIELTREDGWSLSIAFATGCQHAMLVLVEPAGDRSWSSRDANAPDVESEVVVYDFMGSWSEAYASAFIPLQDANLAVAAFLLGGPAMDPHILWTRD